MQEPYAITLSEFRNDVLSGTRDFKLLGNTTEHASDIVRFLIAACRQGNNVDVVYDRFLKVTSREHEALVLDAYTSGIPVPDRVISEYARCFAASQPTP